MLAFVRLPGFIRWSATIGAAASVLSGCSSGGDAPAPATPTGSFQGVVGPPGAATLATATNNQGQVYTATPDPSTGAYAISNVPTGSYTVRFTPVLGFAALSSARPSVQPNQTVSAGTTFMSVTSSAAGIHGLVAWQYDGKSGSSQQLAGSLSADSLRIVALGSTSEGSDVVLRVKPFTGLGTYSLSSGSASAVFRRYLPTTIASYGCTGAGASGTLIVTRYDAATRTLVGTFAFTANALLPATGTVTVSAGSIDLRL